MNKETKPLAETCRGEYPQKCPPLPHHFFHLLNSPSHHKHRTLKHSDDFCFPKTDYK